ncbi:MAG: glycosyl transferase group 1 [Candidatus Saccharibacteria bacterium]|nr:glycosyl transferase group 1 [Candidatus Saccharibacteria bacterium]
MKILHTVEFYYPSIGGAQEVVRHLSERMVRLGHDVTVVTTAIPNRTNRIHNGVKIVDFEISGNTVNGIKGEKKKYHDFLRKEKFDVVMNYAAQQWTADAFFEVIDDIKAKKIFVPCGYSALYDPAYINYFKKLPAILKKYDATVYLSSNYRDINFARDNKLRNITIIPNGANEEEFTDPLSPERIRYLRTKYGIGGLTIMTIGLYGEKGHMDVLRVFRKLPVSKATFISAGSIRPQDGHYTDFEAAAERLNLSRKMIGKRVVMVDGGNREDVRDLLKMSDIYVFLSNIECSPLVLFEAAAAGVPFIATPAGNSAEIAKWTGSGIIVKSHPAENSRVRADLKDTLWQLTKLAHSPKKRKILGEKGHDAWKMKYTWDRLTEEYLTLYEDVLKGISR